MSDIEHFDKLADILRKMVDDQGRIEEKVGRIEWQLDRIEKMLQPVHGRWAGPVPGREAYEALRAEDIKITLLLDEITAQGREEQDIENAWQDTWRRQQERINDLEAEVEALRAALNAAVQNPAAAHTICVSALNAAQKAHESTP